MISRVTPMTWYISFGPFASRGDFAFWQSACAESDDPLFFAVVDRKAGAQGVVSFTALRPGHGVIEVGLNALDIPHGKGGTEAAIQWLGESVSA